MTSLKKKHAGHVKSLDNLLKLKISPDNVDDSLLTNEEFVVQKNAVVSEMSVLQEQLKDLDERQDKWLDLSYKTFDFCRRAKERFETGTLREKKLILKE